MGGLFFDEKSVTHSTLLSVDEFSAQSQAAKFFWGDFIGVHDSSELKKIGAVFNIDSLLLEDIQTTDQRPKIETNEENTLIILRIFDEVKATSEIHSEQISILITKKGLVTFQEVQGDIFVDLRQRLKKKPASFCQMDYLLYCILDLIVDHCFNVMDFIAEELAQVEAPFLETRSLQSTSKLYGKMVDVLYLKRFVFPLKEILYELERQSPVWRLSKNRKYYRDLSDHILQLSDSLDSTRDTLGLLAQVSLSVGSHKTNEIMRFLTLFAAIFIPLTFLSGIYGMNFRFMPWLESPLAFPIFLGVCLVVSCLLIAVFYKKRWL